MTPLSDKASQVRLTTFNSFLEGAERYAELEIKDNSEEYLKLKEAIGTAKYYALVVLGKPKKIRININN